MSTSRSHPDAHAGAVADPVSVAGRSVTLQAVDASGRGATSVVEAVVEVYRSDTSMVVAVGLSDGRQYVGRAHDVEGALGAVRRRMDPDGVILACNRFRPNALVSSGARAMSDGQGCYLVKPRTSLSATTLVDSLGPAEPGDVAFEVEADAHIERWRQWFGRPRPARVVSRAFLGPWSSGKRRHDSRGDRVPR